jgi:hypothetical protein
MRPAVERILGRSLVPRAAQHGGGRPAVWKTQTPGDTSTVRRSESDG